MTLAPPPVPAAARGPLLVVHVTSALDAQGRERFTRTEHPCRALGELEHVAVVSGSLASPALLASGLLDEADVVVLADAADPDLLPILETRRRAQRLTIYEIGTHLFAPPARGRTAPRARDLLLRAMPAHLARHADGLQLATPALEARFGALNPRRAVFASQLWTAPVVRPRARPPGRVVVGWGGGLAHADDLAAVAPALRAVLERHAEVDLALMGDAALADPSVEHFAGLPTGRVTLSPLGSPDDYGRFLDGLDVGLAPLAPTEFNRCRDDARYLEYAAHGVLAVCADLEPYRASVRPGHTGFLFRDAAELEAVLERALAEPELRATITATAAREVGEERLERRRVGERLAFYVETATRLGLPLAPRAGRDPLARLETAPSFAGSRYVALGGDATEALLRLGLEERRAGRLAEARRCFTEARRASPRAYFPELLLGETEEDPSLSIEALERAAELNPRSCLAPYLLGVRLGYAGAPDEAAAALQRARSLAPSLGAPQERLAELAESAGRIEEACQLYEEAALQNGAYALPVARLAAIALGEGRVDRAVGLLERSLDADPELWLTNFVLGRAYLEQRRFHEARVHLLRAVDGAEDRALVLAELAKAELGVGDLDAARGALAEARRAPDLPAD
ncbi:MAG TPA: glycosyltransferase [Polyangia bacterium]|nr:glycosyltransferase [Polyangia bacterium]